MEYLELLKLGIGPFFGAILGFLLSEILNFSIFIYNKRKDPKLKIDILNKNGKILSHDAEIGHGQTAGEVVYGFRVCNVGKKVSSGVRFDLTKLECRNDNENFRTILNSTYKLHVFSNSRNFNNEFSVTLTPGSSVLVELAREQEGWGFLIPSISHAPDYYEDIVVGSDEYRLTVVCYDDKGRYDSKELFVRF